MMVEMKNNNSSQIMWSYRWISEENPVAFFGQSNAKTNILYSKEEIESILGRTKQDNLFVMVPLNVLKNALDALDSELTLAA